MLDTIKCAISPTPKDGAIYLVEKLSENTGFFVTNGHLLYLVYNFEGIAHKSMQTDYLLLNTDVEIHSFKNNQKFPSGKYNVLDFLPTDKGYDENNLDSFVNLCVSHTELMEGKSFLKFFFSLSELFQDPKSQEYKNLVGFFGELSFLKFLCEKTSLDLSDCWHKGGSKDKYEITLETKNLEIKTTAALDEEVTIKHSQLFNADRNYLVVVCIEENSAGQTLNQLISAMQNDPGYYNNYNFALNIQRERRRVSPVEAESKFFSVKNITVYSAEDINPFREIPESVSHLIYKLDLIDKKTIPLTCWEKEFKDV